MANFTLTAGADTVVGGPADDTVVATGDWTFNAGDRLTGGAGTDTLALSGVGPFRVDQLATFTGFENITITNNFPYPYGGPTTVFLGNQSIAVTGYGEGSKYVYLGSGAVTLQGINSIDSTSASNWNAGNSIDGGNIRLGSNGAVYDLTMNKLSHINSLQGAGNDLTVNVNSAVAAGVANFMGLGTNNKLVTSDAALDLSHSTVSRFAVASGNASGTNFTVSDINTALQIVGGSGNDTVTAQNFTFSADQRNAIFGTASVERIVDASGTYTAPQNPKLTAGSDTVTGTATNDTVNGTAATLNAGDSLAGGAGTDTLALYGSGNFQVDQLASFTGFESITITNYDFPAAVYLGSQSIAVTGYGAGDKYVYLGSGAVTFQAADSGLCIVSSNAPSNWNAGNSIDGGSFGTIFLNGNEPANATYDLTMNKLSHINSLQGAGNDLTVIVNSAVAGGVASFIGRGPNNKLVTSDAALDLSHSTVNGFTITTSNTSGTNFAVSDMNTALQIVGGSGSDTITAQGFVFNADQRKAIFATSSIETIIDSSGTYTVHPAVANIIPDQISPEDQAWSFQIPSNAFSDADGGHSLTYLVRLGNGDPLPSWLAFNSSTQTISGTPPANFNGQIALKITASDGSLTASDTFALNVTAVNDAPIVTSNSGGDTARVSITENTTAVTTVTAADPDAGQALSYAISGGADASKFAINAGTGALSFITAPNFELPTDAGANNIYDVTVQVSDGSGGIDTQAIAVTVFDVLENSAPIITSNGGGNAAALSIAENATAVTTVTATDLDSGQILTYSISGGADAGKFSIDSNTGALSFITAPNFEAPTDVDGNNVYDVTVQISDGLGGVDTQAIAVKVENVVGVSIIGTPGNDLIDATHTVAGQPFRTNEEDTLNGGSGADQMSGGAGNDAYFLDNISDVVTENANEGSDTVYASADYRLLANVETLVLQGPAVQGYGNALANTIVGTGGDNILDGDTGADTMFGGAGNDAYFLDNIGNSVIENANEGSDTIYASADYRLLANVETLVLQGPAVQGYGNALANTIVGTGGDNILDGDTGADTMFGGAGNDAYFLDNIGNSVIENANEGSDTIYASADYRLLANVETLVLQGSAVQGYGNALANTIVGTGGDNILDGDTGADTMFGGAGNDAYLLDNIGDSVIENANEGSDTVYASANYRLLANVEYLVLQGPAVQGYGNALANAIVGTRADNLLDGDAGADSMYGGAGNDAYFLDNAGDFVIEYLNEGNDTVYASVNHMLAANVENLVLQGSGNLSGRGNALANTLYGNPADNTLDGGAAADFLQGNAGNDTFVFNAGQANGDMVADFAGNDGAVGDALSFVGFGTAAQGATFMQVGATNQWQIHSGLDAHNEFITFSNGATIDPNDFLFG